MRVNECNCAIQYTLDEAANSSSIYNPACGTNERDNRRACLHKVSTKTISVKYVVHIIAEGFQLNKVKELDSIVDAGGSELLGQSKARLVLSSLVSGSSECGVAGI